MLRPLDDLGPPRTSRTATTSRAWPQLWKGQDGNRYGAPKDWDTVAIFYDRTQLKAAGVDRPQLDNLTWNPKDGGTFEKIVAHLTVDTNGVRGDEPGFDKNNVKMHGLAAERLRRRRLGPDPVVGVHRQRGLAGHRQEPVGHAVPVRQPPSRTR